MTARFFPALCAMFVALGTAIPAGSAVREVFAADAFELKEGQRILVDAWELEIHLRSADTQVARITTDLHISGLGAAKADAWIAARTPVIENSDKHLSIKTTHGDEGFLGLGSLTRRRRVGIVAPQTSTPDITTSDGPISIEGDFLGADPMRLRTANGDMTMSGAAKSLEVRTTSGNTDISLIRPLEKFWIRTSSGSVTLTGGTRNAEIETASGDINLSGLSGGGSIETVTGDIVVAWDRLPTDATVKLRSIKGSITIVLPPETAPQGMLSTTSGEVSSEFQGQVADDGVSVSLTGSGPTLNVETASGAIILQIDRGWFAPKE